VKNKLKDIPTDILDNEEEKNKLEEDIKSIIDEDWAESGMYGTQLNFFSDTDFDKNKIKDVKTREKISDQEIQDVGCFHVNSMFFCENGSREDKMYDMDIKIVEKYRNVIGRNQPLAESKESNAVCLAPWLKRDTGDTAK
jgi:hypothetical protein